MESIPYYYATMTVKAPLCIDGCIGTQAALNMPGYAMFVLAHLFWLGILMWYIYTRR